MSPRWTTKFTFPLLGHLVGQRIGYYFAAAYFTWDVQLSKDWDIKKKAQWCLTEFEIVAYTLRGSPFKKALSTEI